MQIPLAFPPVLTPPFAPASDGVFYCWSLLEWLSKCLLVLACPRAKNILLWDMCSLLMENVWWSFLFLTAISFCCIQKKSHKYFTAPKTHYEGLTNRKVINFEKEIEILVFSACVAFHEFLKFKKLSIKFLCTVVVSSVEILRCSGVLRKVKKIEKGNSLKCSVTQDRNWSLEWVITLFFCNSDRSAFGLFKGLTNNSVAVQTATSILRHSSVKVSKILTLTLETVCNWNNWVKHTGGKWQTKVGLPSQANSTFLGELN